MNLIFNNGEELFYKLNLDTVSIIESLGINLHQCQKTILMQIDNLNKKKSKIYGDDFLIEFTPKNVSGKFALSIKDFDENQNKECEINVEFSEQELGQLIHTLQYFYDTWDE